MKTFAPKQMLYSLKARQLAGSWVVLVLAMSCLVLGGYYVMYQLFFIGQGLEDLALERFGRPTIPFKYEGVQWFRGTAVERAGPPVAFDVRAAPVLTKACAELEVYVQARLAEGATGDQGDLGTLRVMHRCKGETSTYEETLTVGRHHFSLPYPSYTPQRGEEDWREKAPTVTSFQLMADDGSPIESVLVGTKLRVRRLGPVFAWLAISIVLLTTWLWAGRRFGSKLFWVLAGAFVLLFVFRCGTFISNDFFLETSGQASVFKTSFGHTRKFIYTGEFYPHVYKRAGHFAVPALTMMFDRGAAKMPTSYYVETWPTPRYIWFVLESIGALLLTASTYRYLSQAVAMVFPLVYVTFPPILFNVYNMEDDALLILGMLPMTALLIRVSSMHRASWIDVVAFAVLMLSMIVSKTTTAFLLPLIPAAFLVARWVNGGGLGWRQSATVFVALLVGLGAGQLMAKKIGPKVREAQPGYAYQDHNLWEMLWAAYGLYDRDSAHPFIKAGRIRDRVVAEAIAKKEGKTVEELFPDHIKRLRHAAAADELVYKPQLRAAWKARPTFFFNHQLIRFWHHGLLFYGYPDRGRYWRQDVSAAAPADPVGQEELTNTTKGQDGMGFRGHHTLVQRSRFDPVWKIAPQVLVVSLFNFDRMEERKIDILLTVLALAGIVCMRRVDLALIFVNCVVAKVVFNTFIHGKVRYFDWVHAPMLLALAVLLVVALAGLREAARRRVIPVAGDGAGEEGDW